MSNCAVSDCHAKYAALRRDFMQKLCDDHYAGLSMDEEMISLSNEMEIIAVRRDAAVHAGDEARAKARAEEYVAMRVGMRARIQQWLKENSARTSVARCACGAEATQAVYVKGADWPTIELQCWPCSDAGDRGGPCDGLGDRGNPCDGPCACGEVLDGATVELLAGQLKDPLDGRCACGGVLVPTASAGRTGSHRGQIGFKVPDDMLLPTCQSCGAEMLDDAAVELLNECFERQFVETWSRFYNGDPHHTGLTVEMSKLEKIFWDRALMVQIWHEDTESLRDPDAERVTAAWKRLFGEDMPKPSGPALDGGDFTVTSYAYGRLVKFDCDRTHSIWEMSKL